MVLGIFTTLFFWFCIDATQFGPVRPFDDSVLGSLRDLCLYIMRDSLLADAVCGFVHTVRESFSFGPLVPYSYRHHRISRRRLGAVERLSPPPFSPRFSAWGDRFKFCSPGTDARPSPEEYRNFVY